MAFIMFEKAYNQGATIIRPTGESFKLAGYNLIYQAWLQKGKPVNCGWHVSADELLRLYYNNAHSSVDRHLIIDFDPNSTWRIGLIELLDVYAFTWGDQNNDASWTPLMLRMRDVYYDEFDQAVLKKEKPNILNNLPEPKDDSDFIEFLYLNGPGLGWNWGKNGMTNAVFLQGKARDYFKQYF